MGHDAARIARGGQGDRLPVVRLSIHKSMRAVAVFEIIKGGIAVLAGFGALRLLHRDVRALAVELVGRFHLNPEHRIADSFVRAAENVTDKSLWIWAGFAAGYAVFRFVEGYGLWHRRSWAEWLALVSGGIYLPVEIYEVTQRLTWIRVTVLVANIAVVVLMALALLDARKKKAALASASVSTPAATDEKNSRTSQDDGDIHWS